MIAPGSSAQIEISSSFAPSAAIERQEISVQIKSLEIFMEREFFA
jgi:hypothetical protein